jgi:uncharacterized protein YkwD
MYYRKWYSLPTPYESLHLDDLKEDFNMIRKFVLAIMIGVFLSGCSQSKLVNSDPEKNIESSLEVKVDKVDDRELEDKIKQEEEARKKALQEAKAKEELEVKARAEQEAKAQQAVKPVLQSAQSAASKPIESKPMQPVQASDQTPRQNGTSTSQQKHPVEYNANIENEILVLVNQERAKIGVKPLTMNETLRTMARFKSNDMLQYDYFDHTSPNIGGLGNLAKKFSYNYTTLGENIWISQSSSSEYLRQNTTAAKIMNGWMNSPGHKANILNPSFGRIGIGVTFSTDGLCHATQEFSN